MTNIHVGTSGWHYKHWKGPFYPEDMPPRDFLAFYADRFRSTEINNSFYKQPEKRVLRGWRDLVGNDFVFAFKANRYITHMKKLKDPKEPLSNLYGVAEALGDALGPILFQLPPRWKFNEERLQNFLSELSDDHRHTFEFRDESWLNPRTLDLLREYGQSFCIYELGGMTSPTEITSDFVYIRLHGPGDKYQGRYDTESLRSWADAISSWERAGKDVYCYFDNDDSGYAAMNAAELAEMVT